MGLLLCLKRITGSEAGPCRVTSCLRLWELRLREADSDQNPRSSSQASLTYPAWPHCPQVPPSLPHQLSIGETEALEESTRLSEPEISGWGPWWVRPGGQAWGAERVGIERKAGSGKVGFLLTAPPGAPAVGGDQTYSISSKLPLPRRAAFSQPEPTVC